MPKVSVACRSTSSVNRASSHVSIVQRTTSPWVWASGHMGIEEVESAVTAKPNGFFLKYGPHARYVPPKDFDHELPASGIPEVAFVGRSNVGKSSLLAAILGTKKKVVRISKTPGCTSSVNYFSVGDTDLCNNNLGSKAKKNHGLFLVDLPGYGFSKRGSRAEQQRWGSIMDSYLTTRGFATLRRVLVLVDVRRGPLPEDWWVMERLSASHVPFQVVLTKVDTVLKKSSSPSSLNPLTSAFRHGFNEQDYLVLKARSMQLLEELARWCEVTATNLPTVHAVSAKEGSGIRELQAAISAAALLS